MGSEARPHSPYGKPGLHPCQRARDALQIGCLLVPSGIVRLPPHTPQFPELLEWINATHPGPVSILDVGGGGGFYDFPATLRSRARRMVGVDPDSGVLERPWLDEEPSSAGGGVRTTPRRVVRFDVALCVYVVEHVESPGPFLEGVRSLLEPGGSCFGVTPNLWHYFSVSPAPARPGLVSRIGCSTGSDLPS